MTLRAVAATAALAASVLLLTGCLAPAPEPEPTPTGVFASEEEAFAAAEETYRAYVDAVNARRADPMSQPDPQSFLISEALEADIDSRRNFDELGIHIVGNSEIASFEPLDADLDTGSVVVEACYDSSEARVLNEAGEDVTVSDRDPTILLEVRFERVDELVLIAGTSANEDDAC